MVIVRNAQAQSISNLELFSPQPVSYMLNLDHIKNITEFSTLSVEPRILTDDVLVRDQRILFHGCNFSFLHWDSISC